MKTLMNDLHLNGLIAATVLPMTPGFQIDEPGLRRYARWLLGHEGLAGVAVNVDTGEGPSLTPAERRRVLSIWVEESGGRVPVIAGIGGPSTALAQQGARDAYDAGASAVLVFPIPAFLGEPLDPEVPYAYHRSIETAGRLPIILFQLQASLGGVIFSTECLERLLSIESVVAVKEASFDRAVFKRVRSIIEKAPREIVLLTGNDTFILESFEMGAEGALIGFGTLAVAEQIRMIRAALTGDWDTAREANAIVGPLADAIFAPPVRDYRARAKYALGLLGVLESTGVRPPLLPLSEQAKTAVRVAMQRASVSGKVPHPEAGAAKS